MDRPLIWSRGRVIPAAELAVSPLDRAFEHGLGLFETLRTWNGRPTLLARHRERMLTSARALGLAFDEVQFPDEAAVLALVAATDPRSRDLRLRITLSGGRTSADGLSSTLWMTAGPLPAPIRGAVAPGVLEVAASDPLARHKTLNYWRMRLAHEHAVAQGEDEVLCVTPDGRVHQGTRTNIVWIESETLVTPADDGPVLPGIMRETVLEQARNQGFDVQRAPTPLERLRSADEAFLTSSVRGIVPLIQAGTRRWPRPGPLTRELWNRILPRLQSGEPFS